jgi:hypothetical protein
MDHILQTKLQKYFRKLNNCVTSGFRRGVNGISALLECNGSCLVTTNRRCLTLQKNKYIILTLQRIPFLPLQDKTPTWLRKI